MQFRVIQVMLNQDRVVVSLLVAHVGHVLSQPPARQQGCACLRPEALCQGVLHCVVLCCVLRFRAALLEACVD